MLKFLIEVACNVARPDVYSPDHTQTTCGNHKAATTAHRVYKAHVLGAHTE